MPCRIFPFFLCLSFSSFCLGKKAKEEKKAERRRGCNILAEQLIPLLDKPPCVVSSVGEIGIGTGGKRGFSTSNTAFHSVYHDTIQIP